jgi:hypothetical protein
MGFVITIIVFAVGCMLPYSIGNAHVQLSAFFGRSLPSTNLIRQRIGLPPSPLAIV